jgi:hypothetical protein
MGCLFYAALIWKGDPIPNEFEPLRVTIREWLNVKLIELNAERQRQQTAYIANIATFSTLKQRTSILVYVTATRLITDLAATGRTLFHDSPTRDEDKKEFIENIAQEAEKLVIIKTQMMYTWYWGILVALTFIGELLNGRAQSGLSAFSHIICGDLTLAQRTARINSASILNIFNQTFQGLMQNVDIGHENVRFAGVIDAAAAAAAAVGPAAEAQGGKRKYTKKQFKKSTRQSKRRVKKFKTHRKKKIESGRTKRRSKK